MFTVKNTLNDILNDEVVMAHFEFMMPMEFLEIVPEELRDLPQHEESFTSLTGGDESLRDKLSIYLHVTSDYPKTFVWACN